MGEVLVKSRAEEEQAKLEEQQANYAGREKKDPRGLSNPEDEYIPRERPESGKVGVKPGSVKEAAEKLGIELPSKTLKDPVKFPKREGVAVEESKEEPPSKFMEGADLRTGEGRLNEMIRRVGKEPGLMDNIMDIHDIDPELLRVKHKGDTRAMLRDIHEGTAPTLTTGQKVGVEARKTRAERDEALRQIGEGASPAEVGVKRHKKTGKDIGRVFAQMGGTEELSPEETQEVTEQINRLPFREGDKKLEEMGLKRTGRGKIVRVIQPRTEGGGQEYFPIPEDISDTDRERLRTQMAAQAAGKQVDTGERLEAHLKHLEAQLGGRVLMPAATEVDPTGLSDDKTLEGMKSRLATLERTLAATQGDGKEPPSEDRRKVQADASELQRQIHELTTKPKDESESAMYDPAEVEQIRLGAQKGLGELAKPTEDGSHYPSMPSHLKSFQNYLREKGIRKPETPDAMLGDETARNLEATRSAVRLDPEEDRTFIDRKGKVKVAPRRMGEGTAPTGQEFMETMFDDKTMRDEARTGRLTQSERNRLASTNREKQAAYLRARATAEKDFKAEVKQWHEDAPKRQAEIEGRVEDYERDKGVAVTPTVPKQFGIKTNQAGDVTQDYGQPKDLRTAIMGSLMNDRESPWQDIARNMGLNLQDNEDVVAAFAKLGVRPPKHQELSPMELEQYHENTKELSPEDLQQYHDSTGISLSPEGVPGTKVGGEDFPSLERGKLGQAQMGASYGKGTRKRPSEPSVDRLVGVEPPSGNPLARHKENARQATMGAIADFLTENLDEENLPPEYQLGSASDNMTHERRMDIQSQIEKVKAQLKAHKESEAFASQQFLSDAEIAGQQAANLEYDRKRQAVDEARQIHEAARLTAYNQPQAKFLQEHGREDELEDFIKDEIETLKQPLTSAVHAHLGMMQEMIDDSMDPDSDVRTPIQPVMQDEHLPSAFGVQEGTRGSKKIVERPDKLEALLRIAQDTPGKEEEAANIRRQIGEVEQRQVLDRAHGGKSGYGTEEHYPVRQSTSGRDVIDTKQRKAGHRVMRQLRQAPRSVQLSRVLDFLMDNHAESRESGVKSIIDEHATGDKHIHEQRYRDDGKEMLMDSLRRNYEEMRDTDIAAREAGLDPGSQVPPIERPSAAREGIAAAYPYTSGEQQSRREGQEREDVRHGEATAMDDPAPWVTLSENKKRYNEMMAAMAHREAMQNAPPEEPAPAPAPAPAPVPAPAPAPAPAPEAPMPEAPMPEAPPPPMAGPTIPLGDGPAATAASGTTVSQSRVVFSPEQLETMNDPDFQQLSPEQQKEIIEGMEQKSEPLLNFNATKGDELLKSIKDKFWRQGY